MIALTSTQGSVTATYRYSLAEADGGTAAMKKADGDQLARLAAVVEGRAN
jgi:hypothetical protein